ncbi:sensor histidine kinase [Falsiroseomonas bella]|nr:HWE histidine kinase domain-containing protein [Falsiroseomonas bella]
MPGSAQAEAERLAALHRYHILDTPDEEPFNRVALLARDLFDTPIALVSFIDEERQWFKARVGLSVQQTPREWAFCTHAIASGEDVFVVPDARQDPRFADNPLVTDAPSIRFYAAAPLRTPDGFNLGTVCVISDKPRPEGISAVQRRWLGTLAGLASDELELRLQARRAREAAEAEARLRRAQEAAGVVAFEVSGPPARLHGTIRGLLGLLRDAPLELHGQRLLAAGADRARLEELALHMAREDGEIAAEFRALREGDETRWVQLRGEVRHEAGPSAAWRVAGLLQDVTERRRADERQELMTRELDHRAKNALAVVLAALRLTPREEPRAYAAAVEGRVAALARAHTLLTEKHWAGADLGDLVRGELRPFLSEAATGSAPRARLVGPTVLLSAPAAQPLSMALHELATNAVKHGALSAEGGRVSVTWSIRAATLRLRWAERGGPPIPEPPARQGFGSRVMRGTIVEQLGGRLDWAWPRTGLVCEVALPVARAVARIG